MTTKILVPDEWEKLSSQDKELAKGWIKSILDAEKSRENLLKLLFSNAQSSTDFLTQVKETLDDQDILEILGSAAAPPPLPETPSRIEVNLSDSLIKFLKKLLNDYCELHPRDPLCPH